MNVLDSSGWLSYFAGEENADIFEPIIAQPATPLVPTIAFYEVYKRIALQRDVASAQRFTDAMRVGHVVQLDARTALLAAALAFSTVSRWLTA